MSVVSPPPVIPPEQDELEALIREARARQRKRWLGAAALVAFLAGGAFAAHSITSGGSTNAVRADDGNAPVRTTKKCGIQVAGTRILRNGARVYRDPSPVAMSDTVRCSGQAIWVVFVNGVGMMHEEYVGVRSADRGRTWHVVFAQQPGLPSRRGIDAEVGPWKLAGPRVAYFVGSCPACGGFGTVSLSVTTDAGRTFRRYRVPGSDSWVPRSIRVRGNRVSIRERRDAGLHLRWKTVTIHTA
jgi:hypothetical protein